LVIIKLYHVYDCLAYISIKSSGADRTKSSGRFPKYGKCPMDRAAFYRPLDIAVNYLSRRGHHEWQAQEKVRTHICRLWLRGEGRPLMLTNLAIAVVEREEKMEESAKPS
jgi:hypothetical protein